MGGLSRFQSVEVLEPVHGSVVPSATSSDDRRRNQIDRSLVWHVFGRHRQPGMDQPFPHPSRLADFLACLSSVSLLNSQCCFLEPAYR